MMTSTGSTKTLPFILGFCVGLVLLFGFQNCSQVAADTDQTAQVTTKTDLAR